MRQNAEAEKSQARLAESSMNTIEAKAAAQYAKDQAAEEKHRKETLGSWDPDEKSGYLYNAVHRHYFEPNTGKSESQCTCCNFVLPVQGVAPALLRTQNRQVRNQHDLATCAFCNSG